MLVNACVFIEIIVNVNNMFGCPINFNLKRNKLNENGKTFHKMRGYHSFRFSEFSIYCRDK